MKAFYFSNRDRKLRYDDNRVIRTGRTHKVKGEIIPCGNGLHASERLIDALYYAPDTILWHVELGGTIVCGDDKVTASERTYLASFDATELLRAFARKQALINIERIKPHCSAADYDLIVRYLVTGDEEIRIAARKAAKRVYWAEKSAYWAADLSVESAYWAAKSAYWAEDLSVESTYWVAKSTFSAAKWAACAPDNFEKHMEEANKMLTDMVREATGWAI